MLTLTAQDTAAIQYPVPSAPFFVAKEGYEWKQSTYVVRLSDYRPEDSIRAQVLDSLRWAASASNYSFDEVLDWEFTADPAPGRKLGTMSVTLKYVSIGAVADIEVVTD
jgi:hypothetical protein